MKKIALLGSMALAGLLFSCSSSDDDKPVVEDSNKLRVIVAVLDANGDAINVQDAKGNTTKDYVMSGNGYQHRVLIEDFTGAWCGWCPRVSSSIETLESQNNDKIVAVALHNGDKMAFTPHEYTLYANIAGKIQMDISQGRGFPFAAINRNVKWIAESSNTMSSSQVLNLAKDKADVGIKISSKLEKEGGTVKVSFKFAKNFTEQLKYVVYIVQDGIVMSQENYTSNYGGKGRVKDFEHNAVAKALTGNVLGEAIPADKTNTSSEYVTSDLSVTYKAFK